MVVVGCLLFSRVLYDCVFAVKLTLGGSVSCFVAVVVVGGGVVVSVVSLFSVVLSQLSSPMDKPPRKALAKKLEDA